MKSLELEALSLLCYYVHGCKMVDLSILAMMSACSAKEKFNCLWMLFCAFFYLHSILGLLCVSIFLSWI